MPCSTLRPDCLASRSSACATRCSTCCGRHLDHAGMGFLQPAADGLQRVGGKRREFRHQARPRRRRPDQHDAVVDRGRGGGIARQSDRHRDAEGLARRDIAHHDLFSGRRGLAGADMAMQQHEEGMRIFALFEHRAVLRKSHRAGFAQDFAEFLGAKSRKQRQMGNQRRVDCGHVSSVRIGDFRSNLDCDCGSRSSGSLRWRNIGRAVSRLNRPRERPPTGRDDRWRMTCAR